MPKIRIIGGEWKGRRLEVLDAEGLRPTTDRNRERLFNWLQFKVAGKRALDLFAGSGALGFEALSRGAEFVTFIEKHAKVAERIRSNVEAFGVSDRAQLVKGDALKSIEKLEGPFDIVFIDPPFASQLAERVLTPLLERPGLLSPGAYLYIEAAKPVPIPDDLELIKEDVGKDIYCALGVRK